MIAWLRSTPTGLRVEAFVVANLGFLGVDIALAHAQNAFQRLEEWIPLGFSAVATLLLLPGVVSGPVRARMRPVAIVLAACSVGIGVAGMLFHLQSAFFASQTLHGLVYTAPFVAPLAYVGVGLLLLLNRMEPWGSVVWQRWVIFLALGGFVGNLALTLLDHAQNGFFHATEWLGVGASAFATSFLLLVVLRPEDHVLTRACQWVLGAAAATGVVGFALHALANLHAPGSTWLERFIYGAPPFAPLLLADLALLGVLGLSRRPV